MRVRKVTGMLLFIIIDHVDFLKCLYEGLILQYPHACIFSTLGLFLLDSVLLVKKLWLFSYNLMMEK